MNIVRGRHTVIKESDIENILKEKVSLKCQIPSSTRVDVENIKAICSSLRRLVKNVFKGTKQRKLLHAKVAKARPLKVRYELGEDAVRAFVKVLQDTIFRLERDVMHLISSKENENREKVQEILGA